ncbi:hypothetical protein [Variovorax paradoxus]|uniref:hypothetical protein n=1 Tax=Variovorax paradoxus TaxID=34073 RepID=UPI003D64D8F6
MPVSALRLRENLSVAFQRGKASEQRIEQLGAPAVEGDDPPAVYDYLGDMQLRFMFTASDGTNAVAKESDLQRLNLTPQLAMTQVTVNSRRARGAPKHGLFGQGVYQFTGRGDADTDASYLLDRGFWRTQLQAFPKGVVAAIPRRGSLFFADAGDSAATEELARMAARLHHAAGEHRVSNFLYIFGARGWEVLGALPAEAPAPTSAAGGRTRPASRQPARESVEPYDEEELSLSLVASGQKTVIYCLIANFVLSAAARGGSLPPLIASALYIGTAAVSLFGIVRICSGLGLGTSGKILFMVLAFVPLVNLIALVYLSARTNRLLRAAGWRVGLLGAKAS